MASTSETGHAKNVAILDDLISSIKGFGETYNPSKEALKLTSIQALSKRSKDVMNLVNATLPAYTLSVATRETSFSPFNKLVTRVVNSLKATDVPDRIAESALTFSRKIQGRRATAKRTEEEKLADTAAGKDLVEISSSQMGYDMRLDNFDKLIKLLASVELYAPNEADLKVASLTAMYEDLKIKNSLVIDATTPLKNSRIQRNEIFYNPGSGLVDVAMDVKAYIKSVFGASSAQYKQVSKLEFRKN